MTTGYEAVKLACLDRGLVRGYKGRGFSALCPAHEDSKASLNVDEGDGGTALIYCFAGCETRAVVEALGLNMKDLFGDRERIDVAQYVYTDEEGQPLIRVTRTQPKGFTQERWDPDSNMWKPRLLNTRRVLYHLPNLVTKPDEPIWMFEGEKDVETAEREGVLATTVLGGAGNWREEYAPTLRGRNVQLVADNDDSGIAGAMKIRNALRGIAKGLEVWKAPEGHKDLTDMVNEGLGMADLVRHEMDMEMFAPLEWDNYVPEDVQWLLEPYVPKHARVLAFGPAGSLKSLWAMWLASKLAKDGHRVAYFSLEMQPKEVARRLSKLDPPPDRFKLFQRLSFDSSGDLAAACDLLRGYSLIVVDSWSAVHGDTNNNDAVAKLDREFFLPLIEETGATLLILDNTGQGVLTDRGKLRPDWARGASAKGDKMDVTIFFDRPDESDNYLCQLKVKKMRLDRKMPKPAYVRTDTDRIEFRFVDDHGVDLGDMWAGTPKPKPQEVERPLGVLDKMRQARAEARLKEMEA